MAAPFKAGPWFDSLSHFEAGMDSDKPAPLLPKNQLAYIRNGTLRGGYITNRPAYRSIELSFTNSEVQSNFETKRFQGATFYQPDTDPECLIVQIGGRLFRVTPSTVNATVEDISVPSDPNDESNPQAWLWQFEKFVAINDGENQCIFFDGNSSRRSNGTLIVLGTTAAAFTVPAIGSTVSVPLTGEFLGQVGDIVLINGRQYEVVPNTAVTYEVTLTNLRETATTLPVGTLIEQHSNRVCQTRLAADFYCDNNQDALYSIPLVGPIVGTTGVFTYSGVRTDVPAGGNQHYIGTDPPSHYSGPACNVVTASNENWSCGAITPPYAGYIEFWTQQRTGGITQVGIIKTIPAGAIIRRTGTNIVTTIGEIEVIYNVPGIGGQANATLDRPYSGADGASVWINGSQWLITKVPSEPVGSTVTLKNINDTNLIQSGDITNIPELPIGRMGAYGLGRNWVSLADGITYIGSDLVGGSSGTPTNQFRDAPMRTIENFYLAGGGTFRVPAAGQSISAMRFPATLDSSLGQGALQVLTQGLTFSCNAPVDRESWQDVVNPIQTQSLIGGGATSHYSCVAVNGDLWFRSLDGIRSLKLARQDFLTTYANTPQSTEMNRVLLSDNSSLLIFASSANFDNRLLMTAQPTSGPLGVYHPQLVALNNDPSSSLHEKLPNIYDGAWTGMNVFQLATGTFNDLPRCFAFCYDEDNQKITLNEILPSEGPFADISDGDTPIEIEFESPVVFNQTEQSDRQLLRLIDGEIIVQDIQGDVTFEFYFRPDYDPTWHAWHSWTVNDTQRWRPRMGLGEPTPESDPDTERPYRVGYHFQVKGIIRGHCRFMGINVQAVTVPTQEFAGPMGSTTT